MGYFRDLFQTTKEVTSAPPKTGDKPRGSSETLWDELGDYILYHNTNSGTDTAYLDELKTPMGKDRFLKMLEGNPLVNAYRNMVTSVAGNSEWWIGEDKESYMSGEISDPREKLITKAMDSLLRDESGWTRVVKQAMTAPVYGASLFEITYKELDGEILWDNFGFRPYYTIKEVLLKKGKFVGFRQSGDGQWIKETDLNKSSMMIITYQPEYGPLGRSIFYSSYPAFRRREEMDNIALVGARRNLNAPMILQPTEMKQAPTDLSNTDAGAASLRQKVNELLTRANQGQQGAFAAPIGYKAELPGASAGSRVFDITELLHRQDHAILSSALASHLLLPEGNRGSYALAVVNQIVANLFIDSVLDQFADAVNKDEIPRLLELNGFPTEDAPKLNHTPITELLTEPQAATGLANEEDEKENKKGSKPGSDKEI